MADGRAHDGAGRFAGRTVVLTGGCGQIGRATATRLAREGARLFLVDRDEAPLEEALAALRATGADAAGLAGDVSDGAFVRAYAEAASAFAGGGVDGFFNNAGIEGPVAPVHEVDEADFDAVVAVNLRGVFLGLKEMVPRMAEGGAIVNAGSTASVTGTPNLTPYVATKHAVLGLTRCVAVEAAPRGVRVTAVCPGGIESRMMSSIASRFGADADERILGSIPAARYGTVEEVAAMVAFLLSDDASYVSGSHHLVDGAHIAAHT